MSESPTVANDRTEWYLRPAILLAATYMLIMSIHESAHALTAYALNVPFTLFHYGVNLSRDRGPLTDSGIIALAGPLCSLIVGLLCWFFYKRARGKRSELLLLYLVTFGAGGFFGNLMSSAFTGGDFGRVALALRLPMASRYAASLIGLVSVSGLHFWAGWELRRMSPGRSTRFHGMLVMVLLPVIGGTAIVALSNVPIPSVLVFGRFAEVSFWMFAAVGILMSRTTPLGNRDTLHLGWADLAMLLVAVIVVRILATGIEFQP